MPAIRHELADTGTARWYQAARGAARPGAWEERTRCFTALASILAERPTAPTAGELRGQPVIELSGVLTRVAARAHFGGAEPVYRRWRVSPDGRSGGRWAGPDPAIRPGAAFLAEAKIVSFWPYREGVLEVADAFDMTRPEITAAYLRAIAAWVSDDILLAACRPAGPPGCVPEDMAVLAERRPVRAARLTELAGNVVASVLTDTSITPLGAFNAVREEAFSLVAEPVDPLADRVSRSAAELADRILHGADDEPALSAREAGRMLVALRGLVSALDGLTSPPEGDR